MAKEVNAIVKLQISAGKANPAPPIGSALGPHGINLPDFCKKFNDKTKELKPGQPVPTIITIYKDRSFEFSMKLAPVTFLIKEELKLESGSKLPGTDVVAKITRAQIEKIAKAKMPDLNANDIKAACLMVAGSARSMGIEVVE